MADWTVEPGGLPRSRAAEERVLARDAELLDALPDDGSMGDERERLRWIVERLSYWMDAWFEVPGTGFRIGLDPIVGLLPGIGDAVSTVVSLYIISLAGRCGLPRITLARMSLNVLIDMLLGAVPLVGDVFDAWWKANQKNAKLLAARVADPAAATRRASVGDWLFVGLMLACLAAVFIALAALSIFVLTALWHALQSLFAAA